MSSILPGWGNMEGSASEPINIPCGNGPTPVNVWEYEAYAAATLPKNAFDYYSSGANDMITLRENRSVFLCLRFDGKGFFFFLNMSVSVLACDELISSLALFHFAHLSAAFNRLRMRPRILRDVSQTNITTTILGDEVSMPILLSPTAMQQMAHPEGERATARAAAGAGTLMTLSSWSTIALEEVMDAAPQGLKWFQLYVYKDRDVTLDLIKRAEKAGYKALAITVDTPVLGRREADLRNSFKLPSHLTMGNFAKASGAHNKGTTQQGGLAKYVASLIDKTLNWEDIVWVRSHTTMKIVVKGVMTAEDAKKAVENGVDGILVSNHGARQLDTVPATIEMLPEIVEVVKGRCEVYLDGGVCRGTDALKALALGARAVLIGRPYVWGLAHNGEAGVKHVLQLLRDELIMALQLCGCTRLSDIKPEMVRHHQQYLAKL
jgi:(S)-2-hydroxy-acid oxidase